MSKYTLLTIFVSKMLKGADKPRVQKKLIFVDLGPYFCIVCNINDSNVPFILRHVILSFTVCKNESMLVNNLIQFNWTEVL